MSLTAQQLTSLKELYASTSVNKLTHEECQEILFNQLCDELDLLTEEEIEHEIVDKDSEQFYDDLVNIVCEDDTNSNIQL